MSDAWQALGIDPTDDAKAIRRAYAVRLKALDQAADPAGFQNLRAAYEWALHQAARARLRVVTASPAPPMDLAQTPPPPVSMPTPAQREDRVPAIQAEPPPDAELQALVQTIRQAVQAGRYDEAFAGYDQGSARGIFPFGHREFLLDAMMDVIVRDAGLSPQRLEELLGRAGWRDMPSSTEPVSKVRHAAMRRQEADAWFLRMQALARGDGAPLYKAASARRLRPWDMERRNAGLFFGKGVLPFTRKSAADLHRKLAEYDRHAPWLTNRIDPAAVARARRMEERYDSYGFLIDPLIVFVVLALWLGRDGGWGALPFAAAGAGLRGLLVYRRHRKAVAG